MLITDVLTVTCLATAEGSESRSNVIGHFFQRSLGGQSVPRAQRNGGNLVRLPLATGVLGNKIRAKNLKESDIRHEDFRLPSVRHAQGTPPEI